MGDQKFFIAFSAIFGLTFGASFSNPNIIRQLDDAGLAVASNLRFEGAGGENSALKIVKNGESLDLRCEAFGQPAPVVYWTRNGEPLGTGSETPDENLLEKFRNFGIRTYQIGNTVAVHRIQCASAKDRGIFTCVAENGYQTLKRNVKLIVGDGESECVENSGNPPLITMWSDLRMDREFADVQVYCRGTGEPKPKIHWFNAEGIEIKDGIDYQTLPNGDLLVKNVQFWVNGGGFKCVARNKFGEDVKESFLYTTKYDGEDENLTEKAANEKK